MKIPNEVIEISLVVFLFTAMVGTMYIAGGDTTGRKVVINCDVSEISPDFTTEMREACRQARSQNILTRPK